MYEEDDLLPVSALSQLLYCERRCALILTEGIWEENVYTVEGRLLHERVDAGGVETRPGVRTVFSLRFHSLSLGLSGISDVVEFYPEDEANHAEPRVGGQSSNTLADLWNQIARDGEVVRSAPSRPYPVEYKRGRPKPGFCDQAQLCAHAICLEEMLAVPVTRGALFYATIRRRREVDFDAELRRITSEAAMRLHSLVDSGMTPLASYTRKCDACSLLDVCLPKVVEKRRSVWSYINRQLRDLP